MESITSLYSREELEKFKEFYRLNIEGNRICDIPRNIWDYYVDWHFSVFGYNPKRCLPTDIVPVYGHRNTRYKEG